MAYDLTSKLRFVDISVIARSSTFQPSGM